MVISKDLRNKKKTIISYFRNRASEFLDDVDRSYALDEFNKKASKMNIKLRTSKEQLIQTVIIRQKKITGEMMKSLNVYLQLLMQIMW